MAGTSRLRGFGDLLAIYQVNTVLAERGSPLDVALRSHSAWQERYRGRIGVVYARRRAIEFR